MELGQLATVGAGNSAPQEKTLFSDGTTPFFRTSDIGRVRFGDIETSTDLLNESGTRGLRLFPAGTILFPKSGASTFLNHRVMMQVDGCVSSHLATITTNRDVAEPRFLLYFLATIQAQDMVQDHAYPSLNLPLISGIRVPTPTIEEQRRIVTLLDEAFTDIATAKANAEKNLQNARELFNSHLDAFVGQAQENGEIVALSELATDITDGDHMPPPKVEQGLPFITIGNIDKQTRTIDFADTFKVPREYFDALKANKKPMRGDVLYTVTGSFGIPVLVEEDAEFCFQRHIGLIRPKADVDSTWLHYLLQSPQVFKQAADGATGTAQKTVSLKVLRNLQVPKILPTQQLAHVETLKSVETECRHLEAIYRQKLTALDNLKKSLLHQAFSGQL